MRSVRSGLDYLDNLCKRLLCATFSNFQSFGVLFKKLSGCSLPLNCLTSCLDLSALRTASGTLLKRAVMQPVQVFNCIV